MNPSILCSRRVVTPEGVRPAGLEIHDGRIVAVHELEAWPRGLSVHDAHDAVLSPGLVDSHVHINEPGRTTWEGFAHATRAAAAGGVTTLADMPLNCIPATVNRAALSGKRSAANGQCHIDVGFLGGVVPGKRLEAEITGLQEAGVLGFKCFLVPSGVNEFTAVSEADLARALPRLAALGATLMVHAEWPATLAAASTPTSTRSHAAWAASRPAAAEAEAIERIATLAETHGARVHIVHVSSAEGCRAVATARARGVAMTAETCPHYLVFTGDDVSDGATEFKCAPPLRTAADRDALWAALEHGTLDQIVSDHSPSPAELKAQDTGDFIAAWGGIASLQLGLPAVWTAARERGIPFARLSRWMSAAPARLLGLQAYKGVLAPGFDADVVVWTPEQTFTVDPAQLQHRHPLTPYRGRTLHGVVHATYLRGQRVFAQGPEGFSGPFGRLIYPETILA